MQHGPSAEAVGMSSLILCTTDDGKEPDSTARQDQTVSSPQREWPSCSVSALGQRGLHLKNTFEMGN